MLDKHTQFQVEPWICFVCKENLLYDIPTQTIVCIERSCRLQCPPEHVQFRCSSLDCSKFQSFYNQYSFAESEEEREKARVGVIERFEEMVEMEDEDDEDVEVEHDE